MLQFLKKIDFKSLQFIVRLLWKTSPVYHIINIVLLILQSIIPLIILYLIKLIFDTVAQSFNTESYNDAFPAISWQLSGIIALSVLNHTLISVGSLVKTKHNQIISEAILEQLHKKSISVDLEYYENPEYHDTFYRVQTDTQSRIFSTFNQLQSIFQNLISLAAMTGMLLLFHWATGIILLISLIPGMWGQYKFSKKRYDWQQERTAAQRESFYYGWLLSGNYAAKEMRTFNLGELFRKRAQSIRENLFKESYKITTQSTLWGFGTKIIELLAVYGLFLFLIVRTIKGYLSIGDLVMYYHIFTRGQNNISALLNGATALFVDNLFFNNLIRFLNYQPVVNDPAKPIPIPEKIQKIDLKNICFHYPNQEELVLKNINLHIKAGDKIAIVGKNGSGKTSLIKLICRLYNPTSGSIMINGTDYANFKVQELRENIGILFQDYVNYQMKASENIRLGNVRLTSNNKKIKDAAECSGADEFIRKLPLQYEALLGRMFEKGEELSIGQWQKIALSRVLVRDAPVIILDEPTSSMDADAEGKFMEQIIETTKDKILILISHRLSTIKSADCIYFLEDGEIIEYGTHEELMNLNGKYAGMFNCQTYQYTAID